MGGGLGWEWDAAKAARRAAAGRSEVVIGARGAGVAGGVVGGGVAWGGAELVESLGRGVEGMGALAALRGAWGSSGRASLTGDAADAVVGVKGVGDVGVGRSALGVRAKR